MEYRNLGRSGLRVSEVALGSWLTFNSSVIVGVTRPEQLDDNVKASGTRLPDDLLDRIDEIFPAPAT